VTGVQTCALPIFVCESLDAEGDKSLTTLHPV
jgi:hypothetical protein